MTLSLSLKSVKIKTFRISKVLNLPNEMLIRKYIQRFGAFPFCRSSLKMDLETPSDPRSDFSPVFSYILCRIQQGALLTRPYPTPPHTAATHLAHTTASSYLLGVHLSIQDYINSSINSISYMGAAETSPPIQGGFPSNGRILCIICRFGKIMALINYLMALVG